MAGNSDKVRDAKFIGHYSEKLAKAGYSALHDVEISTKKNECSKKLFTRNKCSDIIKIAYTKST